MWEPRRLTTLWSFSACYRDSFNFFFSTPYSFGYKVLKAETTSNTVFQDIMAIKISEEYIASNFRVEKSNKGPARKHV
jgi:hypothetical protein